LAEARNGSGNGNLVGGNFSLAGKIKNAGLTLSTRPSR